MLLSFIQKIPRGDTLADKHYIEGVLWKLRIQTMSMGKLKIVHSQAGATFQITSGTALMSLTLVSSGFKA